MDQPTALNGRHVTIPVRVDLKARCSLTSRAACQLRTPRLSPKFSCVKEQNSHSKAVTLEGTCSLKTRQSEIKTETRST